MEAIEFTASFTELCALSVAMSGLIDKERIAARAHGPDGNWEKVHVAEALNERLRAAISASCSKPKASAA